MSNLNSSSSKSQHPPPHRLPRTPSHPHLSSTSWTSFKNSQTSILQSKSQTVITPSQFKGREFSIQSGTGLTSSVTCHANLGGSYASPSSGSSIAIPSPGGSSLERKLSVIEGTPRGRFAQSYGSVERISVGRSTSFCARPSLRRQASLNDIILS